MSETGAVVVCEGSAQDLDGVMAVMGDSFDPRFGEAWTAAQCSGLLHMAGVWLAIARDGDQPIGFALARKIADEAELLLLAVRRSSQGRGIGGLLLRDFVREAARRGAARLHLEVRDGNPAARLYTHEGFAPVGRRPNYYTAGRERYDALTLARTL